MFLKNKFLTFISLMPFLLGLIIVAATAIYIKKTSPLTEANITAPQKELVVSPFKECVTTCITGLVLGDKLQYQLVDDYNWKVVQCTDICKPNRTISSGLNAITDAPLENP